MQYFKDEVRNLTLSVLELQETVANLTGVTLQHPVQGLLSEEDENAADAEGDAHPAVAVHASVEDVGQEKASGDRDGRRATRERRQRRGLRGGRRGRGQRSGQGGTRSVPNMREMDGDLLVSGDTQIP